MGAEMPGVLDQISGSWRGVGAAPAFSHANALFLSVDEDFGSGRRSCGFGSTSYERAMLSSLQRTIVSPAYCVIDSTVSNPPKNMARNFEGQEAIADGFFSAFLTNLIITSRRTGGWPPLTATAADLSLRPLLTRQGTCSRWCKITIKHGLRIDRF